MLFGPDKEERAYREQLAREGVERFENDVSIAPADLTKAQLEILLARNGIRNVFSALGTQLLLNIAEYLDLPSRAAFAQCSHFARVRLTLALKGSASPGFGAIRSFCLNTATSKQQLRKAFFARATNA